MWREGFGVQHAWVLCWSRWGVSVESFRLSRWMLPFRAALQLPSQGCCQFPASLTGDSTLTTATCPLSPLPHSLQQHLSEQALFLLRIALQSHRSCFPAQSLSSPEFSPLGLPFFSSMVLFADILGHGTSGMPSLIVLFPLGTGAP